MISIIEYGMGNVRSVYNAISMLGEDVQILDDPKNLSESDAIILPGVGSFSKGMDNLKEKGFVKALETEILEKKKPYLGICLGHQFLAEKSYEGGLNDGFGWIKGTVKKITPKNKNLKIPHMGWDDTQIIKNNNLFMEIDNPIFYYLHSYYFDVVEEEKNTITSFCNYGDVQIPSTIQKNNIFSVQFHPEKSQSVGIKLLKNFIDMIPKTC
jgi:imidazole glycerol-phosphate synthase subunit HisH